MTSGQLTPQHDVTQGCEGDRHGDGVTTDRPAMIPRGMGRRPPSAGKRNRCVFHRHARTAPMATLRWFREPWITAHVSLENPATIDARVRFVHRATAYLGDLVIDWMTVNGSIGCGARRPARRGAAGPHGSGGDKDHRASVRARVRAYRVIHPRDDRAPWTGPTDDSVVFGSRGIGNPASRLAAYSAVKAAI